MEIVINSEYDGVRSLERWGMEAFYYEGVDTYAKTPKRQRGIHTIIENGIPIDIYEDLNPGAPLVIFLNGALTKRGPDIKLPIFSGFGVIPAGNLSRVCISDPVLYLNETIALGWYAGCSRLDAQSVLAIAINSIIEQAKPSRVIFVGPSGGGFACLYYSRQITDSIALVWNPQTDITRYNPKFVAEYAQVAFGLEDGKALPSVIETSVVNLYAQGYSNRVLYLQNAGDWHVKHHLSPFLSAQGYVLPEIFESRAYSDRLYLHMGNWGEGHHPPPPSFLKSVLARIMENEHDISELFRPEILQPILSDASAVIQS